MARTARSPPGRDMDGPAGDRFKRSKLESNSFQCLIEFIVNFRCHGIRVSGDRTGGRQRRGFYGLSRRISGTQALKCPSGSLSAFGISFLKACNQLLTALEEKPVCLGEFASQVKESFPRRINIKIDFLKNYYPIPARWCISIETNFVAYSTLLRGSQ